MRPHLPEEELHAWLDGQLSRAQAAELAEHLLGCLICRALEAEVRGVRDRTQALLALAAPRVIKGVPQPTLLPRRVRRRLRGGSVAAAAAVVVGLGSWAVNRNQPTGGDATPRLATAFVAPAIFARAVNLPTTDSARSAPLAATPASRTLTLASRATLAPRVIPPRTATTIPASTRRLRVADPMLEVGPSGEGWETTSLAEAREAASGALAHLDGIPVNAVRLQPSQVGGRPTAMVRHLLPDGRAVWVVEGTIDDLEPVYRVLEASGLSLASPRRARFDYGSDSLAPTRMMRMVTVASYLPVDSLEVLAGARLKLDE